MPPKKRKTKDVKSARRTVRQKRSPQRLVGDQGGVVEEEEDDNISQPLRKDETVRGRGNTVNGLSAADVTKHQEDLVPLNLSIEGNDDVTMALAMDIAAALRARRPRQDVQLDKQQEVLFSDTMNEATTRAMGTQNQAEGQQQGANMSHANDNLGSSLTMLLGTGESQSQDVPSVPLINLSSQSSLGISIPQRIKEKIWNNQYIDLGLLIGQNHLPDKMNLSVSTEKNEVGGGQFLSLTPNLRPKPIKNIDDWMSAFIVFTAIFTERHPYQAPRLMKYMEIVRDLAKKGGLAFKIYDENFRFMKQAQSSIMWDIMHTELWVRASMASTYKYNFREQATFSAKTSTANCFAFQKRGFCMFKENCKYAHRCAHCGDTRHNSFSCRRQSGPSSNRNANFQFGVKAENRKDNFNPNSYKSK